MTKHTVIDLPDEEYARLKSAAAQLGHSEEGFILQAVRQAIEDADLRDAEEITRRRLRGESKTFSLEEVSRRLGLDD